jgi:hypothetical protein
VSLEIGKGVLKGEVDGAERGCFLHWKDPPPLPATMTLDGKDTPVYATFDGYLGFPVPAGRHAFEVRYGGAVNR